MLSHKSTLSSSSLREYLTKTEASSNKTTKTSSTSSSSSIEPTPASASTSSSSLWPSFTYRTTNKPNNSKRSPIPSFFEGGNESESTIPGGGGRGGGGMNEAGTRKEERRKDNELDDIAERILYQAGTDSLDPPGPLLILAAVHFPPESSHDHVKLLEKLRSRLEAFTLLQTSYSLVLFASPTPNVPSTQSLISSYLALPRLTRKNVRKVYVVGGGWWSRLILSIFTTTLLSGKTAKRRKIVQCSTLSNLATELGTEQFIKIEIPVEVYTANALLESSITLPTTPSVLNPYGSELDQTGEAGLPSLFLNCINYLSSTAPNSPGIFRRSPSASTLKILQDASSRGHPIDFNHLSDGPYLAASLLKTFLRRMKEPVFPKEVFGIVKDCPSYTSSLSSTIFDNHNESLKKDKNAPFKSYILVSLLPILSPLNTSILSSLLSLLHLISKSATTSLMDSTNLAIVLGPSLIGDTGEDGGDIGEVMEVMEQCKVIDFENGTVNGRKLKGMMRQGSGSETIGGRKGGDNTVGGVLRGLIECYEEIFVHLDKGSPNTSRRPSLLSLSTSSSSILSQTYSKTMSRSTSKSSLTLGGGTIRVGKSNPRGTISKGEISRGEGVRGMFIGVGSEEGEGEVKVV